MIATNEEAHYHEEGEGYSVLGPLATRRDFPAEVLAGGIPAQIAWAFSQMRQRAGQMLLDANCPEGNDVDSELVEKATHDIQAHLGSQDHAGLRERAVNDRLIKV